MYRYTISSALAILSLGTALRAEVPQVMTDIPPVGALVAQVMGELGKPEVLLTAGADPHDFQLRPSQARALSSAGLVVWIGPELTPWLDRAMAGVDPAARLTLLDVKGTYRRSFEDGEAHHGDHDHGEHDHAEHDHGEHAETADNHKGHGHDDHAHDHAHETDDHTDEAHDHGHDHTGTDPHAWLDPGNAASWLGAIAAELSRLDPDNAATYAANAAAAAEGLGHLDAEIAAKLAPVKDRPFVTFHDAYGYFVEHYGLKQIGAVAEGNAASPGAARLRELRATVQGTDVCLFPEVQHDAALVETMAADAGARLGGTLDPEGTGIEPGPDAYGQLLNALADTLVACLKG